MSYAAHSHPADAAASDQNQYLTFFIADEEFAIGILKVREILEYGVVTRVPGAPLSVRGVINLRGAVVPVVDLAHKFGLGDKAVTKRTCVVIVEVEHDGNKTIMGVIADVISQVVDLPASEIEPPPDFGTRVRLDYLTGMGRVDRRFVLILDIDKVLSPTELSSVTRLREGAEAAAGAEAGGAA